MHPDIKAAVEKIEGLIAKEREANERRFAELKQKGTESPEIKAELDKIGKAINAAKDDLATVQKNLADTQKLARENADNIGALIATGGGGTSDLAKERAHAARFFSAPRGQQKGKRLNPANIDLDAYRAYKDAFAELIRCEGNIDALSGEFRAALSVGSDPAGGWLVPDEMSSEIERRIYETSEMRQICRVITIGGPAWVGPWKSSKGTSGGWVGEKQARTATNTPTVGMQRIETHEQYAYPEVTQDMLDDGAINVESFVVDDTQEEMIRTENTAFVSGNGVDRPKGFLTYKDTAVTTDDATRDWGKLQYVVTGASGAFPAASGIAGASDPDCLITIISKLKPAYRAGARWVMNRATEAAIRKLKDGDGRYLVGFGDIRDGVTGFSLFGFPITNLEDMPDISSDSFSVAFGNFQGYWIVDRMGFRLLRDPFTNKPYVGFYITKRVGGDVRNFDMIKLLKFGTS